MSTPITPAGRPTRFAVLAGLAALTGLTSFASLTPALGATPPAAPPTAAAPQYTIEQFLATTTWSAASFSPRVAPRFGLRSGKTMTAQIWETRAARALRLAETLSEMDARLLRAYAQECDAEARRMVASQAPTWQTKQSEVSRGVLLQRLD